MGNDNLLPEQRARIIIDRQLNEAGWEVVNRDEYIPQKPQAIREALTKGGKIRRIYIPESLQKESIKWLKSINRDTGYLFTNNRGIVITTRGISIQLKKIASKYGINPNVVYPHSFRHRFAKNFIEKYNDISLLADLMGHDSIETTRIYLRRTSTEQREIVDRVITW